MKLIVIDDKYFLTMRNGERKCKVVKIELIHTLK